MWKSTCVSGRYPHNIVLRQKRCAYGSGSLVLSQRARCGHPQASWTSFTKMRLIFSIALLQISLSALGQDLLDVALTDKSTIIISKPVKINLREHSFYIHGYMEYLNHRDTVLADTSIIRDFIRLSRSQDTTDWKTKDFNKRLVISENQIINVKKALNELETLTDVEAKAFKKEFRQYNNRTSGWRSYPIRLSKPLFLEDKKLALISVVRGNEGSEISLFELNNGKWVHLGYLERKAF